MRILTASAIAAFVMGMALSAWAGGADDISYRQKVMAAIGAHMGAAAKIVKGEAGAPADLRVHADALAELAKVTAGAFPDGSGPEAGKTGAKPEVWTDPEGFAKAAKAFIALAGDFSAAAAGSDMRAAGKALGALGKDGCKACHQDYRTKHQH